MWHWDPFLIQNYFIKEKKILGTPLDLPAANPVNFHPNWDWMLMNFERGLPLGTISMDHTVIDLNVEWAWLCIKNHKGPFKYYFIMILTFFDPPTKNYILHTLSLVHFSRKKKQSLELYKVFFLIYFLLTSSFSHPHPPTSLMM